MENRQEKNMNFKAIIKDPKIIILSAVLLLLIVFGTLSVLSATYDKIYRNVSVGGIDLGGKTTDEAYTLLTQNFGEKLPEISVEAIGQKKHIEFTDIAEYDFLKTAQNAYNKGRYNIFEKFLTYITPMIERKVEIDTTVNEKSIEEKLTDLQSSIENGYKSETYAIEENELVIYTGHSGMSIDIDKLKSDIKAKLEQHENAELEALITYREFKVPDIDYIYEKIYAEPMDAYFDEQNKKIVPHQDGYNFDKSVALSILANAKPDSVYKIPLTIVEANKKTSDVENELFTDLLGTYTTNYSQGNVNRSHNVALAASKFNGYIMMPGDVFSYNDVVGERTAAKGYRNAAVYTANGVENGIGGGICQVSSTLYNSVLYSNLEIVYRKNHSYPVAYAPKGQDATVSMGYIDFKFKNNNENPIQIRTFVGGGKCTVSIYGKKTKPFSVEVISTILYTNPYTTEYIDDETMPVGQEEIIREGITGYSVSTIRRVTIDGKTITENMPKSVYTPLSQKVKRGTMEPLEQPVEPIVPEIVIPDTENTTEPEADAPALETPVTEQLITTETNEELI